MGAALSCFDCAVLSLVSGDDDYQIGASGIGMAPHARAREKNKTIETLTSDLQQFEQRCAKLDDESRRMRAEAVLQGTQARQSLPSSQAYRTATGRARQLLNKAALNDTLQAQLRQKIDMGEKALHSMQVVGSVTDDSQFFNNVKALQAHTSTDAQRDEQLSLAIEAREFVDELHETSMQIASENSEWAVMPEQMYAGIGLGESNDDQDLFEALDALAAQPKATSPAPLPPVEAFQYPQIDNSHPDTTQQAPLQRRVDDAGPLQRRMVREFDDSFF